MSLVRKIPLLLKHIRDNAAYSDLNGYLFEIFEGELLKFIEQDLATQFSPQFFDKIKGRISPINILPRVVDKLSGIYSKNNSPVRRVVDGSDSDQELLDWYADKMDANNQFNLSDEFFNLNRTNLVQPYLSKGIPKIRVIPAHKFLPYSDDMVDPATPTVQIIFDGWGVDGQENAVKVYRAYSDDEIIIFNSNGDIMRDRMAEFDNVEGINPIGRIPFTYFNRSKSLLIPKADTTSFRMAKLPSVLLSDLNASVMFQAFSIIYGKNLKDDDSLVMSPNALWFLESEDPDKEPEIGSLKPTVDIGEVLNLTLAEIALWLNTRGVRPGAVGGQLSAENFSSAVTKLVDEMDVTDHRRKDAEVYQDGERDFWDLTLNHLHQEWIKEPDFVNKTAITPDSVVRTVFAEQVPQHMRSTVITEQKLEIEAGLTTRRRAIAKLNPRMSESEIDELIGEIDLENTVEIPSVALDTSNVDNDDKE